MNHIDSRHTSRTKASIERALSIAVKEDGHTIIKLLEPSADGPKILRTALSCLSEDTPVTLNLRNVVHHLEAVATILGSTGRAHGTAHVSRELSETLRKFSAMQASPSRTCWHFICEDPKQEEPCCDDSRKNSLLQDIAAALSGRATSKSNVQPASQKVAEKAREHFQQHFTVFTEGSRCTVTLLRPLESNVLREAFLQRLKEAIPSTAVGRLDLSLLDQNDNQTCNQIFLLCVSRKKLGAPSLELILPEKLKRLFPAAKATQLGYVLIEEAALSGTAHDLPR